MTSQVSNCSLDPSITNQVGEYSKNSTMLVNGYQSTLHADKMYQTSLVARPLPTFRRLQYGKKFSIAHGESLGTRLYQGTHVGSSLFEEAK